MLLRFFVVPLWAMLTAMHAATPVAVSDEASLKHALNRAKSGQAIEIEAGRYGLVDLKLKRDVRLVGRGEVVFFAPEATAKGILNPLPGVSLHVENIAFLDATSPDLNGAGIRHDGVDLTVVNCRFENKRPRHYRELVFHR